jgi:hypothetical protein
LTPPLSTASPCERRFVEVSSVTRQLPVHRHHFTWSDEEHVTGSHVLDRARGERVTLNAVDHSGRPVEEGRQLPTSPRRGPGLELAAGGEHEGDDRSSEVLADDEAAKQRQHRDDVNPRPAPEEVACHRDRRRQQRRCTGDRPQQVGRASRAKKAAPTTGRESANSDRQLHGPGSG